MEQKKRSLRSKGAHEENADEDEQCELANFNQLRPPTDDDRGHQYLEDNTEAPEEEAVGVGNENVHAVE